MIKFAKGLDGNYNVVYYSSETEAQELLEILTRSYEPKGPVLSLVDNRVPPSVIPILDGYFNIEIEDPEKPSYIERPEPDICLNGIELRDYQIEIIERAIRYLRGAIELPTGSGKTAIMAGLIQALDYPQTLIITPTTSLKLQTRSQLSFYLDRYVNAKPHSWTTKEDRINIVTYAYILRYPYLIRNAELILIDEAHHVDGRRIFEIINREGNGKMMFGFSATLTNRPKTLKAVLFTFGRLLWTSKVKDMPDYFPRVKFTFIKLDYHDKYLDSLPPGNYTKSLEIVFNKLRNDVIIQEIQRLYKRRKNTLVMFSLIYHARAIQQRLKQMGIEAPLIWSGTPKTALEHVFENWSDYRIVLASTVADEGLDLKNAEVIFMANGEASEIKAIQRAGRGLRGKKKKLEIIDFLDVFTSWAKKRTNSRLKAYIETFGRFKADVRVYRVVYTRKKRSKEKKT